MPAKINLAGYSFGRLTVEGDSGERNKSGAVLWACSCSCGGVARVRGDSLLSGHTVSCGCLHKEKVSAVMTTHGLSRGLDGRATKTFSAWSSMMKRCYGTGKHTKYYKDKGITVCEKWHHYPNFLADMGEAPEGMSLDRRDGSKNYEPGNCRWASTWEQGQNRSNGKLHFSRFPEVIEKRKTMTIKQLAEYFGVGESTMKDVLYQRIPAYLVQLTSQGK